MYSKGITELSDIRIVQIISATTDDSAKVDKLIELGLSLVDSDADIVLACGNIALNYARKLDYRKVIGSALLPINTTLLC